ncbi:DNA recombination protein RmuC [Siculibacillus lacustris]|uniref:DNA recombination protein RmuC homolog n=1 Tax=Siculibacillus lacustris TaxID=1549641 RepID=A0A4Q9VHC7_9HYPH|nr:DNA recombination protein RmuC [Siculibacillus lacustris]TBW33640.1 DNA recombination protein RmuC [Siculibacillus lacustris]
MNNDLATALAESVAAARLWIGEHPTLTLVGAALIVAVLILLLQARRAAEAHAVAIAALEDALDESRDARAEAERRLAAESTTAARVPDLERDLAERAAELDRLRQDKGTVERQLATAAERLAQVEQGNADLRTRLQAADELLRAASARFETLRAAKAVADETLAARTADLGRLAERTADLERRLAAAEDLLRDAGARHEALRGAKAAGDEALAARTTDVRRLEERVVELAGRLETTEAERGALARTRADLAAELARLRETLDQERGQNEEKLALLQEARDQMKTQFQVLAEEVMTRHGESFTKQNKEQVDGILAPLRDKLAEFQQGLVTAQTETTKERATLTEQIRLLSEQSFKMSSETHNLTRALKGKAQTQGAWGEMVLARILEQSGLREGEEYVTQESHTGEDGSRLRPDVMVILPEGRRIVVDSKVSLTAFEEYVNGEDEPTRVAALGRHLASLRTHIRTLGEKSYQHATGSGLDYVVMFVPIEGALAAALSEDPALTGFAAEKNVAVLTPTTLMVALRTIANVWQVDRRNRNAEEIAKRAGLLYEKFVGFVDDLQKVGGRIDDARRSWDGAMSKLSVGSGNLVRQVEQLKTLGARTAKTIPAAVLGDEPIEPALLAPPAADPAPSGATDVAPPGADDVAAPLLDGRVAAAV